RNSALNVTATLTVTGSMTWTARDMNDAGTLIISSGPRPTPTRRSSHLVRGHTINNSGAITWTDAGTIRADSFASVFNNLPGAVFNAQHNSELQQAFGGTLTVNNEAGATFTKSGAGTGTSFAGTTFNNDG